MKIFGKTVAVGNSTRMMGRGGVSIAHDDKIVIGSVARYNKCIIHE